MSWEEVSFDPWEELELDDSQPRPRKTWIIIVAAILLGCCLLTVVSGGVMALLSDKPLALPSWVSGHNPSLVGETTLVSGNMAIIIVELPNEMILSAPAILELETGEEIESGTPAREMVRRVAFFISMDEQSFVVDTIRLKALDGRESVYLVQIK